jgi:hypothetical protein
VEAADNKTDGKQRQGSTNNGLRLSLGPAASGVNGEFKREKPITVTEKWNTEPQLIFKVLYDFLNATRMPSSVPALAISDTGRPSLGLIRTRIYI